MKTRITAASWLGAILLLGALPLQAQQTESGEAAKPQSQQEAEQREQDQEQAGQEEQKTADEGEEGEKSREGNAQFRPSEQISDDLSVSFPVDI